MMNDETPPSVHDSLLTGYTIDGRARTIVMHTEPHQGGGDAFVDVRFDGVGAYRFENDLLQNIVFDIAEASPDEAASIMRDIDANGGRNGFPRDWDTGAETVAQYLKRLELRLFVLSASYGMTGWIAAKSVQRIVRSVPRHPHDRAKEIQDAIRTTLMSDWDPIGIKDEPACADEYDRYVGGVYRLLASGATPEQIAHHLVQIENDMMGLRATPHDRLDVAEKLAAIDVKLYSDHADS